MLFSLPALFGAMLALLLVLSVGFGLAERPRSGAAADFNRSMLLGGRGPAPGDSFNAQAAARRRRELAGLFDIVRLSRAPEDPRFVPARPALAIVASGSEGDLLAVEGDRSIAAIDPAPARLTAPRLRAEPLVAAAASTPARPLDGFDELSPMRPQPLAELDAATLIDAVAESELPDPAAADGARGPAAKNNAKAAKLARLAPEPAVARPPLAAKAKAQSHPKRSHRIVLRRPPKRVPKKIAKTTIRRAVRPSAAPRRPEPNPFGPSQPFGDPFGGTPNVN